MPPRAAIALTAAGALPFVAAALMTTGFWPGDGRALALAYGTVIAAFMAGVHWGFAARGAALWPYALSVLPALHVFFTVPAHPWRINGDPLAHLIANFAALLVLDLLYQTRGLAPRWWLVLRLPVTGVVLTCLMLVRAG